MIKLIYKTKIKLNSVAIVSSQFQLLNAIELSWNVFKDEKLNIITLLLNQIHSNQINKLAKNHELNILFSVKFRSVFQYLDLILKLVKLNKKYEINNLILGHSRNNMMLFSLKMLEFKTLNFVDDGEIIEVKNIKPKLSQNLLPVNYYTIFNLKSIFLGSQEIIITFLNKSENKFSDKILFIDQIMLNIA